MIKMNKMNKKKISFEEILKLFTDMDTTEKAKSFHPKLKLFLAERTEEERHFVGSIFLSLTRDNAAQLLRSIEKRGDIAMLEEMQQMLTEFA
jgi:Tfp pilus assembly pilus retraction ATPase PilT